MDQRTIDYLDANKRYEKAARALSDAANLVFDFVRGVRENPIRVFFEHTAVALPASVTMTSRRNGIDAREWPSAEQLQVLLNEWYEARQLAEYLYKQIPPDEKSLVQSVS